MLPPPLPMPSGPPMTPPGWYRDPWEATRLRYWDGSTWTGYDAPGPAITVVDARPELPLAAALWGIAITAAALIASRFTLIWLGEFRWPIVVYVVLSVILGYGPMLAYCWFVARRWGTGRLGSSLGFRFRPIDAGWGPLVWIATYGATIPMAILVTVTGIPLTPNTEGLSELDVERGVLIASMIAAIICAPFVEELIFRGVIQNGLRSVLHPAVAVGVQAVVFGAAHFDPARGAGNIGLIMVLSAAGSVFGGAAYLLRRIGPSIIAHALMNTVAMIIAVWVAV